MVATLTPATGIRTPDVSGLCLAITEHAPLPMVMVEGARQIVRYINPAFCRLIDQPKEQLVGRPFCELLPENDECVSLIDRVLRTGNSESHTAQQHSEPHPVFWSYTIWPVLAGKRPVGVMVQVTETAQFHERTLAMNEALTLGAVRQHELAEAAEKVNARLRIEITERQQAEELLRESEERFRTLFASTPTAVFVCNRQAKVQYCNRHAVELSGKDPAYEDDDHGSALKLRLPDGTLLPDARSPIVEVLRTGTLISNVEMLIERPDGSLLPVLGNFAALKTAGGEITGAITSFTDITERKLAEDELVAARDEIAHHAQRLEETVRERTEELRETIGELEGFSYSISHDMRAPLRAMQSFAQILLDEYRTKLDEPGVKYLSHIMRSAVRLDRLIQDVLHYTRILHGPLPMETVDLDCLVRDIITAGLNETPVQPRIQIIGTLPKVMGNEALLTQCVSNLLANGTKFVAPGTAPHLDISAEEIGESGVRVWFKDNGIGIAPEDHERIFRLFERIHPAAAYEGTGLGLAIVRKAAERMGAQVGFESQVGQGSAFWIQLEKA